MQFFTLSFFFVLDAKIFYLIFFVLTQIFPIQFYQFVFSKFSL